MKYLGNNSNIVRDATVTATNHQPSSAHHATEIAREGGGIVELSGNYTGQNDATYDVEILNNTIVGVPRVSEPVAQGVGNATMTDVAAPSGMSAQTITATLVDLGTRTRAAYTPFQGFTLRSRTTGPYGNYVVVTVDESGLTDAATDYSSLANLSAGTTEVEGQEWNFGAALLDENGNVPTSAPRFRFGADPQVYRQSKKFRNGRWVYSFHPALVRDVALGAPVRAVSGSRSVTVENTLGAAAPVFQTSHAYTLGQAVHPITPNGHWYLVTAAGTSAGSSPVWPEDGTTITSGTVTFRDMGTITATYSGCTTLYSFLSQVEADTTGLISVDEPVTADYSPAGMATIEVSELTHSFLASIDADGTAYVEGALDTLGLTVSDDAPTEVLRIRCSDASVRGAETWTVEGSSSGPLSLATTGVAYDGADYDFTIPVALPGDVAPATSFTVDLELISRGDDDKRPTVCVKEIMAGAEARTKQYRFVWEKHPTPDCVCDPSTAHGHLNPGFLGVAEQGDEAVTDIPAPILGRAQDLTAWASTRAASSMKLVTADDARAAHWAENDIAAIEAIVPLMYGTLVAIHDAYSGTPPDPLDGAAATEWDSVFTDLQADLSELDVEATPNRFWGDQVAPFVGGERADSVEIGAELNATEQGYVDSGGFNPETYRTNNINWFIRKYEARLQHVRALAGIAPDFDGAGSGGNPIWQDHGGEFWFRSLDGLLALQPGWPYYTAVMGEDDNGNPTPIATREWGAILAFGCVDQLKVGDVLIVDVVLQGGNLRATYQVGDTITAVVNFAAPMELGGGQTGNDTQTWRVEGDVDGFFDSYALNLITPNTYNDGGLTFKITPGSVDSQLGDSFSFAAEGGQFRWRTNGGSWSSATQIAATVSIGSGLSLVFTPGEAPSFAVGDAYSFAAEASFGPGKLRQPTDGALVTTAATVIEITPVSTTARELAIFEHLIPEGTTIRLQGSNNNFVSTPLNELVTWKAGVIYHRLAADVTYAKYRVTLSAAATVGWLYLGDGLQLECGEGLPEFGDLTKRRRLKGLARRAGLGGRIEHSFLTQDSADDLVDLLDHAGENDDGRFGILLDDEQANGAIVTLDTETLEIEDIHGFQPESTSSRAQRCTLEVTPIP